MQWFIICTYLTYYKSLNLMLWFVLFQWFRQFSYINNSRYCSSTCDINSFHLTYCILSNTFMCNSSIIYLAYITVFNPFLAIIYNNNVNIVIFPCHTGNVEASSQHSLVILKRMLGELFPLYHMHNDMFSMWKDLQLHTRVWPVARGLNLCSRWAQTYAEHTDFDLCNYLLHQLDLGNLHYCVYWSFKSI